VEYHLPLEVVFHTFSQALRTGLLLQVLASLGADGNVTIWKPLSGPAAISTYVSTAVASLLGLKSTYGLAGFDFDFEVGISVGGTTEPSWLQAFCAIIKQLKQVKFLEAECTF
jgi:hypothetical protein